VVLQRKGQGPVLLCHRVGSTPGEGWQFPQGGVDPLVDEARRELLEEIGTDDIALLRETRRRYCYTIPPELRRPDSPYTGQCQHWVLAELRAPDAAIRFDRQPAEFDAFEWAVPSQAVERVVWFKRNAYRRALTELGLLRGTPRRRTTRQINQPGSRTSL
jgi:putative (di)nucleoside polyphosphate hydrolase